MQIEDQRNLRVPTSEYIRGLCPISIQALSEVTCLDTTTCYRPITCCIYFQNSNLNLKYLDNNVHADFQCVSISK